MFGDEYPRFVEVSELTPNRDIPLGQRPRGRSALAQQRRMNARYEALFASNRDIFDGARVLDLASHDGRYSFAALKTGAAHVTGVEVRQSLIDKAEETFAFYGQPADTYRFVRGDVFDVLGREDFEIDVVLCLGFLYHTYRHTELLYRLHNLTPTHLILDTMILPGNRPMLRVIREHDPEDIRSAALDAFSVDRVLVAWPTVPALTLLLSAYHFEIESTYDWKAWFAGQTPGPALGDYEEGKRVSLRCRFHEGPVGTGWEPPAPPQELPSPPLQPRHHPLSALRRPRRSRGWRERANRTLARVTGYELRRTSSNV